jgi:hypothetical protein
MSPRTEMMEMANVSLMSLVWIDGGMRATAFSQAARRLITAV